LVNRITKEPLKDIAKLRIRVLDLAKAEEIMRTKLEACLAKWEELCLELGEPSSNIRREDVLRLRIQAHEAFKDVFESQSKMEHMRSHIPESLESLLLGVENDFQSYLHSVAAEDTERTSIKSESHEKW
jgi:hypothetical protein